MSAIHFEQVSLKFSSTSQFAVQDCSFKVAAGQLVVILGPSGCGKTTLLKMVNRLYEPTTGQIYLHGTDIRKIRVTELRRQIGYVIQQSGLFPHMSVAQNIAVVPKLLGWPQPKIQERIDELLALVKLPPGEYRDRYPAQLSGGQQQRVGLARALAGNPDVMLMDEPFGALDAITRTQLQDEILQLQRQLRKTILFVSHDVEEALRLADRILILQRGQIIQYDTPLNILMRPTNAFVYELVGASDILRRLSLMSVAIAMTPLASGGQALNNPAIAPQDNLRQALSLLLQTGATTLTVMDADKAIGHLSLEQIRQLATRGATGELHP